jgi:hypothetical protein
MPSSSPTGHSWCPDNLSAPDDFLRFQEVGVGTAQIIALSQQSSASLRFFTQESKKHHDQLGTGLPS